VQPIDPGEPLVGEGELAGLSGMDNRQQAAGASMDDLLVERAQEIRADASTTSLRVQPAAVESPAASMRRTISSKGTGGSR